MALKVLVVSELYPSPANEVSGSFVHDQVLALARRGVEARVMAPVPWAPFPVRRLAARWKEYARVPAGGIRDGIAVTYPRYLSFPRNILFGYSGHLLFRALLGPVQELYRHFQFDLIHAHVALPGGFAGVLLKKRFGCPLVVTVHGKDLQQTLRLNRRCRQALGTVVQAADRVITVSGKLRAAALKEWGCPEKIVTVENGFDPGLIFQLPGGNGGDPAPATAEGEGGAVQAGEAPGKRKELQPWEGLQGGPLSGEGPASGTPAALAKPSAQQAVMLSVSNLVRTKGLDLNLRAMAALAGEFPGLFYRVGGDGPEGPALRELAAKLGLSGRVTFLGRLSRREVMREMARCDVFSLPSWEEGFGVVYLEAMAHGKPVVACRGEGIADVITHGETGLLVEPRDEQSLVAALRYLLENPRERARMGGRARELVFARYTWDHNAAETLRLYREALQP